MRVVGGVRPSGTINGVEGGGYEGITVVAFTSRDVEDLSYGHAINPI